MTWIIDTNFGSSHFAVDATAPMPTGGGNRALRLGSGVVYENAVSSTDSFIKFDFVIRGFAQVTSKAKGIGFRDSSGNIYFVVIGYGSNNGNIWDLAMSRYTESSDLFNTIATFQEPVIAPPSKKDILFQMEFRRSLDTLSFFIDGESVMDAVDSNFSGPFNPCLAGGIGFKGTRTGIVLMEIDDLQFGSL